jgi:hypothetical protein
MELSAAALSLDVVDLVLKALDLDKNKTQIIRYVDSEIVLYQILNDKERKHKVYVENRLKKIHERSLRSQWFHLSTRFNVSDCLTRNTEVKDTKTWVYGPSFLHHFHYEPQRKIIQRFVTDKEEKILESTKEKSKQNKLAYVNCLSTKEDARNDQTQLFEWITTRRSSFKSTLNVFCYVLRFIAILKCNFKHP